jgi:hypothetical protein
MFGMELLFRVPLLPLLDLGLIGVSFSLECYLLLKIVPTIELPAASLLRLTLFLSLMLSFIVLSFKIEVARTPDF